jgi:hypothetical protein
VTLLGVLVGFELMRRIFYYIVLGKFIPVDTKENYLKKKLSIFNKEKDSKVLEEETRTTEGVGGKAVRGTRIILELFLALICFSVFFKIIVFITPIITMLTLGVVDINISESERALRHIEAASNIFAFIASIILTKNIFKRLT